MTLADVMKELAAKGSETTKRTFFRHGAREPLFGVKVADMKVILKKIKGDQALAMQLFATGNGDAQYLAGLVADGRKMSAAEIRQWMATASWRMVAECSVVWVAAEHPEGFDLAIEWVDSADEQTAAAGWSALGALAATIPDDRLPVKKFGSLLDRVAKTLSSSPNRVRYSMNGFVICCGTYMGPLADKAIATARKLGKVDVDVGDTACKVPDAEDYIIKSRRGAAIAPKRKTVRC